MATVKRCRNGLHDMTPENTVAGYSNGKRKRASQCRKCRNEAARLLLQRRKTLNTQKQSRKGKRTKRPRSSAASVRAIHPDVVVYRTELVKYQEKQAARMQVVHEEVQRRLAAFGNGKWAFLMLKNEAA
jgi:hypothetical protein